MTATPNNNVSKPSMLQFNAFRTDMFGRTKISEPFTLFDATHRYSQNGDFSDVTSGTATVSHLVNESSASLAIGTASGDKIYRETKKVFSYQPGKSLQVMQTFVLAPAKTNLRQRVGYFSVQNGFFLEVDGTQVSFVRRSYSSGQIVETRVLQSEWNVDKLDGNGPSDVVLDLSKAQILFSEYEWLGVGSVRLGFAIDGVFIVAHQFNHANNLTSVYMTTASLPCRYEIENTGATESASTMKQVCVSVISNGGYERQSFAWTAARDVPVTVGTSYYPLVAIKLAAGREDAVVIPSNYAALGTTDDNFTVALIRNPSSLTGDTWTTQGNVQYNNSATAMTGGTVVGQYFLAGGSGPGNSAKSSATGLDVNSIADFSLQLGRTNASSVGGSVSDVFVVAAKVPTGTGDIMASISWFDIL